MPTNVLTPGLKAEIVTTVDDKLVVKHMGGDGVLSTPSMIGLMERTSIQAVQAHLPEGHTTVRFERSPRCRPRSHHCGRKRVREFDGDAGAAAIPSRHQVAPLRIAASAASR